MKKITRILSLLLAVAMVLSLNLTTITALADEYSVTINGTATGHTYEAYQIFTGTLGTDGQLGNIQWGEGIDDSSFLSALYTASEDSTSALYNLFGTDCDTAAEVAEALANATSGEQTDSDIAKAFADLAGQYLTDVVTGTSSEGLSYVYTISGLTAGYYLIKDQDDSVDDKDDAYTRFILKVVKSVEVTPKSSTPTVDKEVKENIKYASNDGYNDVADYNIGDAVPFRLTGTMPSTLADYSTYTYIFHDTMDAGLTFNSSSVTVYIDGDEVDSSCYTVAYSGGSTQTTDGCTFEIIFNDIKTAYSTTPGDIILTTSSKVVVEYTATLNENAEIGLPGNENEVYLEYSNNPNTGGSGDTGKTPDKKVIVFTYELDVTKVDGDGNTLENVEFKLYKQDGDDKYYVIVGDDGNITGWTDANDKDSGSVLKSGSDGTFKVVGLDDGTYYLTETKPLDGYNTIADITLVISATTSNGTDYDGTPSNALTALKLSVNGGTAVDGDLDDGSVSTSVTNNKGAVLPSTGGMGTKIFYTLGGLLVVCAGVLLIVKRRMRNA